MKLTRIYFVRHCEALGNLNRIFQGLTDLDITELGEKQLEKLTERFKNIHIDKIYTSPLIRAKKTALAIKGNRDIELEDFDGIIELDGGIVEGKPLEETLAALPDLSDKWFNHPQDFDPEGGEAMRDAYKRIEKVFFDLARKHKGQTIACASHGGIMRCLLCRTIYNDITRLNDTSWLDNTAVCLFEVDDEQNIEVKLVNDFSHLPNELLRQSSRISAFKEKDNEK